MTKEEKREYMLKWREAHPNYHQEWLKAHLLYHTKAYWRLWRRRNPWRGAIYRQSHRKERDAQSKIWKLANPEKVRAHQVVHNAKRSGKLTSQPCQVCSATRSLAHHADYTKPLEVIWLCALHHAEAHYGQLIIIHDIEEKAATR